MIEGILWREAGHHRAIPEGVGHHQGYEVDPHPVTGADHHEGGVGLPHETFTIDVDTEVRRDTHPYDVDTQMTDHIDQITLHTRMTMIGDLLLQYRETIYPVIIHRETIALALENH